MEPIELSVLEAIRQYDDISQRELSNKVGISLGTVNLLVHKFAKVGLIKIEQLSGKKVKYILTPNGFSVLSRKTIDYISRSYTAVLKIKAHMTDVIKHHYHDDEEVLVFCAQDEVFVVLVEVLKEQGRTYRMIEKTETDMLSKFVHWDVELETRGVFLLRGI